MHKPFLPIRIQLLVRLLEAWINTSLLVLLDVLFDLVMPTIKLHLSSFCLQRPCQKLPSTFMKFFPKASCKGSGDAGATGMQLFPIESLRTLDTTSCVGTDRRVPLRVAIRLRCRNSLA